MSTEHLGGSVVTRDDPTSCSTLAFTSTVTNFTSLHLNVRTALARAVHPSLARSKDG